MIEVLRSNDPVLMSFAEHVLRDAGLSPFAADLHMSVLDGSIMAVQRRLLVPREEEAAARAALAAALAEAENASPSDHDL